MKRLLPIVAAGLILAGLATAPDGGPRAAAGPDAAVPAALLAAHNRERESRGYPPLRPSPRLQAAAQAHADRMAARGRMAHQGIGDGSPFERIDRTGYRWSRAGENVAWNQADVPAVVGAWMKSPGHRWNILGSYAEFGGAVARGPKGDPYWCTVFATPAGASYAGGWREAVYFDGGGAYAGPAE